MIPDQTFFRVLARDQYWFFLEYVHRGLYRHGKHTRYVAERVQEALDRPTRLIVTAPPRHSKSMTITESLPAFAIGQDPEYRVIVVAYGDALAHRFGRSNRQKLQEFGNDLFGIQLSKENASVTNWGVHGHRGGMIAAGIGGPITGEGANLLIIDDPVKNRAEAESPTYRKMVWREWQTTLRTRLAPGGSVILVMTRWHEDDLAGRLLAEDTTRWEHINFLAEAEENDLLGRQVGEPLWPEQGFDEQWLQETKSAVGSQVWAALYNGRPSPVEGGPLKRSWWQYYREPPSQFDIVLQSWDMSFKETTSGSFVVGQVWGSYGGRFYLLDQVRDQMDFPATERALRNLTTKWPEATLKLVENKANGPAIISYLREQIYGLVAVEPRGSKVARVAAVSPIVESGNVYLPEGVSWIQDFIEECTVFPTGKHDDQVDAMSQALERLRGGRIEAW